MAQGQPSPPFSHDDIDPKMDCRHDRVSTQPYTPPRSHPTPQYNYGDPGDYEMATSSTPYSHLTSRTSLGLDSRDEMAMFQDYSREGTYRSSPLGVHGGMQTRSGRSLGSPLSHRSLTSRPSDAPRSNRRRAGRKMKDDNLPIVEPLSEMTKNYDTSVMDMMAWATRPNEERYQELEMKHKGRIPRPMNSFMLYRTAYKERIKEWGQQGDNNQLISKVAGLSWPLEPQHVKDFYAKCAHVERENHGRAFPNYKFAPNKNPKKRPRSESDDDSDLDWDARSKYGNKRMRRVYRDSSRSMTSTPTLMHHSPPEYSSPYHIPTQPVEPTGPVDSWGRPLHYSYGYNQPIPESLIGQIHPTHHRTTIESQFESPGQHSYGSSLVGLPPVAESFVHDSSTSLADFGIDPSLDDFGAVNYQYGHFEGYDQSCGDFGSSEDAFAVEYGSGAHPGMQMLSSVEHGWSAAAAGADFERELQNYEHGT